MKTKLMLPLLLVALSCASCSKMVDYDINDYRTTMKFHDNFRVMQLTDLHLGIQSDIQRELDFISKSIDDADPDLIVLTGDQFMYGSKGMVDNLMKTLNDKCKELTASHPDRLTKFALTHGNHDNHGEYHKYYINEAVQKYVTKDGDEIKDHKYAAFLDYKDDNLSGFTNYFIDLVDDRSKTTDEVDVKYRLHIVDSNNYHYVGPKYKYEVIQQNQLDHIKDIQENATKDKDYIGLAFLHIPFVEFKDLRNLYNSLTDEEKALIGQGEFREGIGSPYENNGSFRSMRDSNIVAYFVGHEHINYCDIIYNADSSNINDKAIFSYGVKSTDQIYHDDDILGYKLINLKDNMTNETFIDIDNIKENFTNVTNRGGIYED